MKKIFCFLITLSAFHFAESQALFSGTAANSKGVISDATVDTLRYITNGSYNKKLAIQVLVSKTSGTMAGTVRLYGSNWDSTGTWIAVSDTLTLSNATTNTKYWELTEPTYKKFMILQSGGTTVKGYLRANIIGIKPN